MTFDLTIKSDGQSNNKTVDPKRARIEAARAAAAAAAEKNPATIMKYIPPAECAERNRIVFDDSGSMDTYLEDAKKGVVEFLRNCIPNQTAVALHFMNSGLLELQSDLPQLSTHILERRYRSGSTPFFSTLKKALEASPQATRIIAFTDGAPTDELEPENAAEIQSSWGRTSYSDWQQSANIIIQIAHALGDQSLTNGFVSSTSSAHGPCIPIDTVYFGTASEYAQKNIELLKYLSTQTGGYFLHFDPAKVNFRTAFKYLAPVHRLMLASESFKADVESGRKS